MGIISRSSDTPKRDLGAQPDPAPHPSTSAATTNPDKYADKLLRNAEPLPPITWSNWYREVRWFNLSVIVITPLVALYGALTTRLETRTLLFCVLYYVFNMIGAFPTLFLNGV